MLVDATGGSRRRSSPPERLGSMNPAGGRAQGGCYGSVTWPSCRSCGEPVVVVGRPLVSRRRANCTRPGAPGLFPGSSLHHLAGNPTVAQAQRVQSPMDASPPPNAVCALDKEGRDGICLHASRIPAWPGRNSPAACRSPGGRHPPAHPTGPGALKRIVPASSKPLSHAPVWVIN